MRIVNLTSPVEARFGLKEGIRTLLRAGFEGIDLSFHPKETELYSDDSAGLAKELLSIADEFGGAYTQAHAPFPTLRVGDDEEYIEYNRVTHEKIIRAIDFCGKVGVEHIVIHPIALAGATDEEQLSFNLEHIGKYIPYAKDAGIKIAIENMWGRHRDNNAKIVSNVCSFGEDLARYADAFNDPTVTVLLDVGHSGLVGDTADHAIRAIGHRLCGLHIHDNDFLGDNHALPYLGKMDFDAIYRALAEVDYKGDITYETGFGKFPDALYGDALSFMYKVGRYMASEIERYKNEK